MRDGEITYTRHEDAELSECLASLDFESNPLNARNLAQEIERRWLQRRQQLAVTLTANKVATGARFQDLDDVAASRLFWPYFWHIFRLGLVFSVIFLVLNVAVTILLAMMAVVTGQSREVAIDLGRYASLLTGIAMTIPCQRFLLKAITSRSYGGYALRVVYPRPDSAAVGEGQAPG